MVRIKSEKYAFWITLTPQLDRCCQGKAEVRIINFKTTWSEFHHLTQSWSKAVVCVSTPRMYPRSGYFLVVTISSFVTIEN